jgi:hypothetical protein
MLLLIQELSMVELIGKKHQAGEEHLLQLTEVERSLLQVEVAPVRILSIQEQSKAKSGGEKEKHSTG